MGRFANPGRDIINAFLHGRQIKQQAERDLTTRALAERKLAQDESELSERKRQFDETIKRLNEQFKADQKFKEAEFNKSLADLKLRTAGEFGKGILKATEFDTSEQGVSRFLGGETSPSIIRLSPNVSFDVREFSSPAEVQRTKAAGIRMEEEARQEAREPFNLKRLVQQHRNAIDLQDKRDTSSAKRLSDQISASGKRLDLSLAAALQRTREQIASREKIAGMRAKKSETDKNLDEAVLVDDVKEGRILADNAVVRKLGYNKLFADNKITPMSKKQFESIESIVTAKNVFEKIISLADLANNMKWIDYQNNKNEAEGQISGIAEVLAKKFGVLQPSEIKRLERLFPERIVSLYDRQRNLDRAKEVSEIYNTMVRNLYANLPEEHRDYLIKKYNMYINYGAPKTKYDLKMRNLIE